MSGPRKPGIVVLGVGNLLMGDEGIGVRCAFELERTGDLPPGVRVLEGGTSTHELLEDLEDLTALVIVDAVASGQPPGTVVRFEGRQIPASFSNTLSPHQHGINDLLATLELLGRAPTQMVLLGIEPQRIALGMELSAVVSSAMPALMQKVREEVGRLAPAEATAG